MDRRGFLKGALSGGALIATASLPASDGDEPTEFSQRGAYERLAMSYATLRVGATKPFSVLHISDTHLADAYPDEGAKKQKLVKERRKTFGGRQEEALADSLAWAKENTDYVLHTGDLIDFQSRRNLDLVKKHFGDFAGVFACVGNHEYTPDMWLSDPKETNDDAQRAKMRGNLAGSYTFDLSFASQVVNGVNFVTLDDVYSCVSEEQVARFRAEVAKGLPIVLCMHVPFFTDEIWRATHKFWFRPGKRFESADVPKPVYGYAQQLADPVTRDFIAYLKCEPLLKAILAGHEHITVQDRFSPTAVEYLVGGNYMFHAREVLVV
ncbi:MAG: metallophosphoesterase [Kiritimatiellae bacterium]|nr:metallophosphoesterase [Kiritimatiellia bacterium]